MAAVETPAQTLHFRCMNAVADQIKALNLTGPSPPGSIGEKVYAQIIPDDGGRRKPLCFVTIEGETEEELDASFETVDVGYPVRVFLVDSSPLNDARPLPVYLHWRRQIIKHFRRLDALPGVPEIWNLLAVPQLIIDPDLPEYQGVVSALRIVCVTTEPRED